jgi:peptide/nickel transport system substrate-binding protein
MNRGRQLFHGFAAAVIALAAFGLAPAALAQQKVLKFIPQADLRILDPITTTAYITRNHGYMVYDTLFATDAKFQVQPQMVDKYDVSADKLTYTFTLRDGLRFHDGQPVRSADCIASVERWAKRDALGQKLAESTEAWNAVNDKTFTLKLKRPFALVLEALAKPSSNVPFIMPERIAKTDASTNITDATGSGPFKFVKEEWVPGSKVVYVKNKDYDALIAQLQKEGDPARRAQLSLQAQDMLLNDVVDIPIASRKVVSAYAKTLQGVDLNPWDSELWNVAGWYN